MVLWPEVPQAVIDTSPLSTSTVKILIDRYSSYYGLSDEKTSLLERVLWCESRYNTEAVGDQGLSLGVAQIHLPAHPAITRQQALDPRFAIDWAARQFSLNKENMWSCTKLVRRDGS